jgi:hypothetical protein
MLISAELISPKEDILIPAQVINIKHDSEGNPVAVEHNNPVPDTRIYKVQFPDWKGGRIHGEHDCRKYL